MCLPNAQFTLNCTRPRLAVYLGANTSTAMRVPSLRMSAVRNATLSGTVMSGFVSACRGAVFAYSSGMPKHRTLPVYCLVKKHSNRFSCL